MNNLTKGAQDVLNERQRQITKEGFDAEHDEQHPSGELAIAAACYIAPGLRAPCWNERQGQLELRDPWPWWQDGHGRGAGRHKAWWKPKTRRQDLVRAAALLIAEIDRIDRNEEKPTNEVPTAMAAQDPGRPPD